MPEGWVYVFRVGALSLRADDLNPIPAGWNAVKDDLCLVKVGKTKPATLAERLNVEARAWGKVPQSRQTGNHESRSLDSTAFRLLTTKSTDRRSTLRQHTTMLFGGRGCEAGRDASGP